MQKIIGSLILLSSLYLFVFTGCSKNEGYIVSTDTTGTPTPLITFNDIDGNTYHGVAIGSQVWMVENLKVTRFNNGVSIPELGPDSMWNGMGDTLYGYCNISNDTYLSSIYGKFYNRNVIINDTLSIAPAGWRLPTVADWDSLFNFLGSGAGNKLREAGTAHWYGPNSATNASRFTALPAGWRSAGGFYPIGLKAKFWSRSLSTTYAYTIDGAGSITSDSSSVASSGFSIRCIKQ